jgi:hypothetical protein
MRISTDEIKVLAFKGNPLIIIKIVLRLATDWTAEGLGV